ncbi:aldose 1-epimerase [Vulcaniibacterium tengchongense]|uniref:Aldose 1-epimerase n=1 Tax=Vulcaniibacterium tengchongense TaxID=1273429 RepID=A0A3N4VW04_9GAMM|nr:aldose 1-epimerase [Vulcaniibacterium tengchongense]
MLASDPLPPGALLTLADGALEVEVAPGAGGRIAQIRHRGEAQLVGHGPAHAAAIAWGCFPMAPWAGRLRGGRFAFEGREYRLPANLGEHAIHGAAFVLPWRVEAHSPRHAELSLRLPEDARWPFGGVCRQRIELAGERLELRLSVTAGARAMPAAIGWHPWFLKPDRLEFAPDRMYPRDALGIAVGPPGEPKPGPWDDCFVNQRPVVLHRGARRLRLTSDCTRWVVFDEPAHSTCVEPQTGPPDAFNLEPAPLAPGATRTAWFRLEWR